MAIDNPHFRKKSRFHERIIETVMFLFALFSMLITVGIVVILVRESYLFFSDPQVDLIGFLTGKNWQPMIHQFGFLPLLNATFTTSIIAMLLGIPIGLFVAIYLAEYASDRMRGILKPVLEILAGIPTIVYGYFALTFMTPLLRSLFGQDVVEIYNTASAGLVIGILVLPLIATMAEDAISSVPKELRLAAYALGGTKIETTFKVVIPAALSGLSATFLLAFSRAIGETMVVALAAGAGPKLTANPFKAAETITGYIVRISGGDVSYNSVDYNSIFALGLVLFIITFILNLVSRKISTIFHQEYE
ncbi:MAG: phosphate ABC transporter permease subunit PstC [Sphaerochaeta sp.]|mgnify:FL=1|jgi:phosphate transport system permease protein|uniref:phosphate ABC transporter permease subunit PstC n=1 Tax=unclassified Sphaerochaeta TaxID=2637943 RepID=UPI000E811559|nr:MULTISPECIES: phosphate ABC transporter permease subunit PstC [unclassified Sphaerochaeta]MCK9601189.1 phosphate ABC transporter permease subunit PstC [Sphaerochaeta sp.]MDX9823377.1 phosphate ABC transporter permease subunit PstC [Sphaerochaeta sp.]HBO35242.1 phosphate ABC transporter permease subunit PstC [Sphaerochaeta sp.]HCU30063.1 phosphate ABC transporter permease subunit PstC [Sphaerochaeta sp.]HPE92981.1 phosphate ABC transporter permease subunit PstC [Sphaerochaeta sp.]